MRALVFTAAILALGGCASSDEHRGHSSAGGYAGEERRAIKALSDDEVKGYLAGAGMGFAKPAELNGYPGPMHTLELATQLQLTTGQRDAVENIMRAHKAEVRSMGAEIVWLESELDALFASKRAEESIVATRLAEIAAMHAKIRSSHLAAHLATTRLLQPNQVREYARLRGYRADS